MDPKEIKHTLKIIKENLDAKDFKSAIKLCKVKVFETVFGYSYHIHPVILFVDCFKKRPEQLSGPGVLRSCTPGDGTKGRSPQGL